MSYGAAPSRNKSTGAAAGPPNLPELVRAEDLDRYPCFLALPLSDLMRDGLTAADYAEGFSALTSRLIAWVAALLTVDYFRTSRKTNELNRVVIAALQNPSPEVNVDLIERLGGVLQRDEYFIDQLRVVVGRKSLLRQCWDLAQKLEKSKSCPDGDFSLLPSYAEHLREVLNNDFLVDFHIYCGTTLLHGPCGSFDCAPDAVFIVNPADQNERQSLHPFLMMRKEVLRYEGGRRKYVALDRCQVFLYNGYQRLKQSNLMGIVPVDSNNSDTFWVEGELPSPGAMLFVRRRLDPGAVFPGQTCKVTLEFQNMGSRAVIIPGFQDQLPNGTEVVEGDGELTRSVELDASERFATSYQLRVLAKGPVSRQFPLTLITFRDVMTGQAGACSVESGVLRVEAHKRPALIVNRRSRQTHVTIDEVVEVSVEIDNDGSPIDHLEFIEELEPGVELVSGDIRFGGPVAGKTRTEALKYAIRFTRRGSIHVHARWNRDRTRAFGTRYTVGEIEWNDPSLQFTVYSGTPAELVPALTTGRMFAREIQVTPDGNNLVLAVTLAVKNDGGRSARDVVFHERLPVAFRYLETPVLSISELPAGKTSEFRYRAAGHKAIDVSWPQVTLACRDVVDGNLSFPVPAFSLERFHDPETIGLIGRQAELQKLLDLAKQANPQMRGGIHGVSVIGNEGIGKSRLLDEFRERVKDWDATEVFHSSVAAGQLESSVLSSLVAGWIGKPPGPSLSRPNLRAWQLKTLAERLASTAQYKPETEEAQQLQKLLKDEERDITTVRGALLALFTDLTTAALRRVIVIVDDLHWLSQSGLRELQTLVEQGKKLPGLFFVFGSRTSNGVLNSFAQRIDLERLKEDESALLIDSIASYPRLETSLRRVLEKQTEGNPFHIIQSLQYLRAAGNLERHGGEWRLAGANSNQLPELLPTESFSLVQRRVEEELVKNGNAAEAELLKVLSLFVKPAAMETLENIGPNLRPPIARDRLAESVGLLERLGFIRSSGGVVEFRADAQREAVQRSIGSEGERAVVHGLIAQGLSELALRANNEDLRNEFYHHVLNADRPRQIDFKEQLSEAALALKEQGELGMAMRCSEVLLQHETLPEQKFDHILNLAEIRGALGTPDVESLFAEADRLLTQVRWREKRRLRKKLTKARMRYEAERKVFREPLWRRLLGWARSSDIHVLELRVQAEQLLRTGKQQDAEAAMRLADDGLRLVHRQADVENECRFLFIKASACRILEQRGKAQELHVEMLRLAQTVTNRYARNRLLAQSSSQVVTDLRSLEREGYTFDRILKILEDALEFQRRNLDRTGEGHTLRALALLHEKHGEAAAAFRYHDSASKLLRGELQAWAEVLVHMASILNASELYLPGLEYRRERLVLAARHLEDVHQAYAREKTYPYEYNEWLRTLNSIYTELGNSDERRACLLDLDRLLGSETQSSGYEAELAELDVTLASRALIASDWVAALRHLDDSEAMDELARKRGAKPAPLRIRRNRLRFHALRASNQISNARLLLRSVVKSAPEHRSATRALKIVLARFIQLWHLNNEPADTILSDYGKIIETVCGLDTKLADNFYDSVVLIAQSRSNASLITELGLMTARVLGGNGDPGAAFRYSQKILEDQYELWSSEQGDRDSLLQAYGLFAQYVNDEDSLALWTEKVKNLFLENGDYSVLGYLAKIQGDRALAAHDPLAAADHYSEAQSLWLEHCPRDGRLFQALSSLVVGFLNCNRESAAVELLESLLEISLETGDYRNVFDYYDMLANNSSRIDTLVVRRLLAKILAFYLRTEQPQRRGHFAYQTSKLVSKIDPGASDAVDIRVGFNWVLIGLDHEPENQFHDMGIVSLSRGDLPRAVALFELSIAASPDLRAAGASAITISNLAVTQGALAEAFTQLGWYDDSIKQAVAAIRLIGINLRRAFEDQRKSSLNTPADILNFNRYISIFLDARACLSVACREVDPSAYSGAWLSTYIDYAPLELDQKVSVIARALEEVEKAIDNNLNLNPNTSSFGFSRAQRQPTRELIDQHKVEIREQAHALGLDVFARRKELDRLFWEALRRVDWEAHAVLLLERGQIDQAEEQAELSLSLPEISDGTRQSFIGRLVQHFASVGRTERVEHWTRYLPVPEG